MNDDGRDDPRDDAARLRAEVVALRAAHRQLEQRVRTLTIVVIVATLPWLLWAAQLVLGGALVIVLAHWWIALPILLGLAVGAVVARRRSSARRERLAVWRDGVAARAP